MNTRRLNTIAFKAAIGCSALAFASSFGCLALTVVFAAVGHEALHWLILGILNSVFGFVLLAVANMMTLMSRVSRIEDKIDDLRKVL